MFLFDKISTVNFLVCTVLCLSYFLANFLVAFKLFSIKMTKAKLKRSLFMAIFYSFIMSLPLMPFVWESGGMLPFLYLFMISCIVWQLLKFNFYYKVAVKDAIIPVSLGNISGWVVMGLVNYWFYFTMTAYFSRFF